MKNLSSGLRRVVSSPGTWMLVVSLVVYTLPVYASNGGNIELLSGPIEKIFDLFTGKIARFIAAMLIVGLGLAVAFSQRENKAKYGLVCVIGVAIMTAPETLMSQLGIAGATF